jgi:hypothetical protein
VVRVQIIEHAFGFPGGAVRLRVPRIERHFARPFALPYVASGATMKGRTSWSIWSDGQNLGFETDVDTSAAGFAAKPFYFAHLEGNLLEPAHPTFVPYFYGQVAAEAAGSFRFRLFMPSALKLASGKVANKDFATVFPSFAQDHGLYVSWLGVQPRRSPYDDADWYRQEPPCEVSV